VSPEESKAVSDILTFVVPVLALGFVILGCAIVGLTFAVQDIRNLLRDDFTVLRKRPTP
jgi:hypothetical protein